MKRKTSGAGKTSDRRTATKWKRSGGKGAAAKSPAITPNARERPVKCASPPCYLSEFED